MAKTETAEAPSKRLRWVKPFQLENAFMIFAIIYAPIALLFLNRGVFAETLLIMYTVLLSLGGLLLMVRFILFLARNANEHSGQYGSVAIMYVLNMLLPILTFKFVAFIVWKMLPCTCGRYGLFADGVRMLRDFYAIYNVQHNLTLLAAGSLVLVAVFTFWSIGKNK